MIADGTASAAEKAHIAKLMSDFAGWDAEQSRTRMRQFSGRVRAEGGGDVLKQTCSGLGRTDENTLQELEAMCLELAGVDSSVDDREARVIRRIQELRHELENQLLIYEVKWEQRSRFHIRWVIGLSVVGAISLTLALLPENPDWQILLAGFGVISLVTAGVVHQKFGGRCPSCQVRYFWKCTDRQRNVSRYDCEVCGYTKTYWHSSDD